MSFPIFPDKPNLSALYGAGDIVVYRRQVGRMPDLPSPDGIFSAWNAACRGGCVGASRCVKPAG